MEEVWARSVTTNDKSFAGNNIGVFGNSTMDGWAARMAENERKAKADPMDRVDKKDISYVLKDWRFPLYDVT